jgi:alginate O-acetyltransferase complex protein AlgI
MSLIQIGVISLICVLFRLIFNKNHLDWFVLIMCLFVLLWLQPISTIRSYDFWIPLISITLGIISWFIIVKKDEKEKNENIFTLFFIFILVIATSLLRFLPFLKFQKIYSIPKLFWVIVYLILISMLLYIINIYKQGKYLLWFVTGLIIFVFVLLKNEFISLKISYFLRKINDQSTNLATASEITWIGYSYFSFRLIHTIIDSQKKGGFNVSLKSYLIYLFYFPALLAGPIEKINNFISEITSSPRSRNEDFIDAGERITHGLFQKFIIADTLAKISFSTKLVGDVNSSLWMWILVFSYSFRIYFDFTGYTNLAIGISRILGIRLSENFNKPLRSPTLTMFWNNWHITLTQWFRAYYFNPMTRALKIKFKSINQKYILGFMQISTMVLIGLWHGISYNFLAWGAWNGIGLFVQNTASKSILEKSEKKIPFWQISRFTRAVSITLTFVFISLGWVWFAFPNINSSLQVFGILFDLK